MTDCLLTFYNNMAYVSCRFWDIQCWKISRPWNHGQRSIKVIDSGTIRYTGYGFLLVFYSNFVPEIFDFKNAVTLKTGYGSVKVENVIIRSSAYDFLLMFHSNHGPISYRFRDGRLFQSKIAKIFHPLVFCALLKEFPFDLGNGAGGQKTRMIAIGSTKKFDDIFSYLDRMHQRDRRSDTGPQRRPRLRIASRGKKTKFNSKAVKLTFLSCSQWDAGCHQAHHQPPSSWWRHPRCSVQT